MSCFDPLRAWYSADAKRIFFSRVDIPSDESVLINQYAGLEFVLLPCGRCIGCAMKRVQQWAMRCRHEAEFWNHNAFVTLTYDDAHLPPFGSLCKRHLQDFLRKLRRAQRGVEVAPNSLARPIRFFACGEYGDTTKRAHYHVLLFNCAFPDRQKFGVRNGETVYTSPMLRHLWPHGNHEIGSVTPASAAYTAGYAMKKINRSVGQKFYDVVDFDSGEVVGQRIVEFNQMSLKPGIGQYWFDKYKDDLRLGFIIVDGKKVSVPRFYDKKFRDEFPELADAIKERKREFYKDVPREEFGSERLSVKSEVAHGRRRLYARSSRTEI